MPERALATAVLCQAIADIRDCRRTRRAAALYRSAYQWLASDDRTWGYSFLNICDALGVSAGSLRRALLFGDEANMRGAA